VLQENRRFQCIFSTQSELPIILANSQAGNRGPLLDPTVLGRELLTTPNPRTLEELRMLPVSREDFRTHFYSSPLLEAQCLASARALGLPPLPPHAVLSERKRQIGGRIGVTI